MNRYPFVSVIIPTRNEEQNIERCLKSIKKQKYRGKVEIIVVDNYSEDKTVELAKKLTKKVFIQGPERSTQRNFGAQIAKGEYLLYIDADMELKPKAVSECISLIFNFPNSNLQPIIALKEFSIGTTFWGKALALEKNCYQEASWLLGVRFVPKKDFLALGGYDKSLIAAEDWDLTLRFAKAGYSILITPTPLITHHEAKKSLIKLLQAELYYIRNIKHYQKKHPNSFAIQANPFYRLVLWLKSWQQLITHPILTLAFLCYKFSVWILWNIE